MADLVNTLKQFNRKERYWLLRNALGKNCEQLGEEFREALSHLVGIEIPADAWWAMDYHLDWLIGALHLLKGGALGDPQKNVSLVTGTQEDMDLVIAFADTLILIEAKADTSWSNSQLNSKVDRLIQIIGGKQPATRTDPTVRIDVAQALRTVEAQARNGLARLDDRWQQSTIASPSNDGVRR